MSSQTKTSLTLAGLVVIFSALAAAFLLNLWGRPAPLYPIPLVDTNFLDTATVRRSYADLARAGEDLSDFDCYACHEKGKPPTLRYDTNQNLIIPKEHSDIVMQHGSHGRNNNCFNCHDENNLTLLQTRDGHEVTFANSQMLCGSCHGPTLRDWQAGAHGRTSGYWTNTFSSAFSNAPEASAHAGTNGYWERSTVPAGREICVNCHNPHSPKFPGRKPAPGPHPLRAVTRLALAEEGSH